jgi:GNAT superfamily N-acetyltransferase
MPGDFSAAGRLEIRITPSDVGKRVSVRRVVEIADGHPTFTDTVGVLASWDAGVVCVTRRTGETVRIAEEALVAGKVVPPAPARRAPAVPQVTAEVLEAVASRAWPPLESAALGGWTLRAAYEGDPAALPEGAVRAGFTRRANSVLVGADAGMPLDEALAAVVAWYGERRLTPWLQVPDGSPYAAAIEERGWVREADSVLRTAPLAPLTGLAPDTAVTLSRTAGEEWIAAYHRTGGLSRVALEVVSGGPSVWFATLPGAIGRVVVDGPWALFGAVEVAPEQRRRGLATAIMGALARRAYDEGATAACLQVERDNEGAGALYDRLGFTDHHGYHYRRPAA